METKSVHFSSEFVGIPVHRRPGSRPLRGRRRDRPSHAHQPHLEGHPGPPLRGDGGRPCLLQSPFPAREHRDWGRSRSPRGARTRWSSVSIVKRWRRSIRSRGGRSTRSPSRPTDNSWPSAPAPIPPPATRSRPTSSSGTCPQRRAPEYRSFAALPGVCVDAIAWSRDSGRVACATGPALPEGRLYRPAR